MGRGDREGQKRETREGGAGEERLDLLLLICSVGEELW